MVYRREAALILGRYGTEGTLQSVELLQRFQAAGTFKSIDHGARHTYAFRWDTSTPHGQCIPQMQGGYDWWRQGNQAFGDGALRPRAVDIVYGVALCTGLSVNIS